MTLLSIDFERHRLDNGLKIVLAPDPTVPVVAEDIASTSSALIDSPAS